MLLTIFLLVILAFLLIPKPFSWVLKRLMLFLLAAGCVLALGTVFGNPGQQRLTVTALDQKNENAEGTEIWLSKVIIEGKEYEAQSFFTGSWLADEGWLKWRSYDKDAGDHRTLTASIPQGGNIQLVFDTCKWRGLAKIEVNGKSFTVDTYDRQDKPGTQTQIFAVNTEASFFSLTRKGVLRLIIVCLTAAAALCTGVRALRRKKQGLPVFQTELKPGGGRELWLDVLKLVSAFFIVQIHIINPEYQSDFGSAGWWSTHFLYVIPRFSVPLFMMISGVLLFGREIPIEKALKKGGKTVVLLFVWNFIYLIISRFSWNEDDIWRQILTIPVKQFSGHLWYIYFLVWMYLFSPILSAMYRVLSVKQRLYFVILTLIAPGILDLYNSWFGFGGASPIQSWQLYLVPSYAGLMVLGRLLYDEAGRFKYIWLCGLVFTLAGFAGAFFLTAAYCKTYGASHDLFISENRLFIVLFAAGVFLMAKSISQRLNSMPQKAAQMVSYLSKRSLGIYLFHCILPTLLPQLPYFESLLAESHYSFYTLLRVCVYFVISVYCVVLMSEIPVLKKTVM